MMWYKIAFHPKLTTDTCTPYERQKPKIYGLHRCLPKEKWQIEIFLFVLASTGFLWNNLWSVSRYVMGPLSGRWRQKGNDQQCLTAPIWKYRSVFGDHRFTFFIDLRPNYTFYTNLTNIVHWVVAYRDVAHLVRLNLGKSWEKSAKSFDAGLTHCCVGYSDVILNQGFFYTYQT